MTLVSVSDCCRMLSIDAKTFHRWLAQAQVSLHAHPSDDRRKGVSSEQLRLLAIAHHRSLPALPGELPALAPPQAPSLPPELLALLQLLGELPAQLSAVQQQLAELTRLLQPHACQPSSPPPKATRHSPKPTSSAARARPGASSTAPQPHKPAQVIPLVEYAGEGHYVVICPKAGLLSLEPDTPAWFAWLAEQSSFRFVGKMGRFSAHHAWRVPNGAWRAHRHIRTHSYTLRLAPTPGLTIAVLEQAAETLQAHVT